MRRKHEVIDGHNISVWDSGKKVIDRYTVVFIDNVYDNGNVSYLGLNETPYSPNRGFCQHGEIPLSNVAYKGRGGVFEKRIKFDSLPDDCRKIVIQELKEG
jgi:hypothetical protein